MLSTARPRGQSADYREHERPRAVLFDSPMRALLLTLLCANSIAAEIGVDNATPARFGASFATVDGIRVARFNGENGVDIPLSTEDAAETEVIAVFRAVKGAKVRLRANVGRGVAEADGVGTGDVQQLSLGRLKIPAGLSRIGVNAPDSGRARVQLHTIKLPGLVAAVSPAILPLHTTYVDEGKGGPMGWKAVNILAGFEARVPIVGELDSQERALSLKLKASGPGKLTFTTAAGAVSVDFNPSITSVKTPPIRFARGTQLLRIRAEGFAVRIDEAALDTGSVSQLWTLPNGNAQSVHYGYPLPQGVRARWAYAEALGEPGPPTTYHCVLGFGQGYFGYQVRGAGSRPDDRWFIYSLWDNGYVRNSEKNGVVSEDLRDKVVTLVSKGAGVVANAFDHEGSGGHSHWDFVWKDREPYKFLLGVKPDGKAAVFSAYVAGPGIEGWKFLAAFRRPDSDASLDGLYSFVEDWSGRWGDQQRACRYRNLWVCGEDGKWSPLLRGHATATAELGRGDFSHNLVDGTFELRTGGYDRTKGTAGKVLTIPSWGEAPQVDFDRLPKE